MSRMKQYEEHVNKHQRATAKKFQHLGHVLVAYEAEQLPDGIRKLKSFVPRERKASPDAVAERIAHFLKLSSEKQKEA